MAKRACSPLACLTSLTPPEQVARLNDKVVSANLSWFRAPRKIDTYFSLLRCSLKCDIINCSSFFFFFFFPLHNPPCRFLIRRFKALGHRGRWAGLSQCQPSSSDCLWSLEVFSAEVKKRKKSWVTARAEKQNSDGCRRWVLLVLWTIFILVWLKWIYRALWPTLSSFSVSLSHGRSRW